MNQDKLIRACKATLLFHSGCYWTPGTGTEWEELTGRSEATTKALCDFIREAVQETENYHDVDGNACTLDALCQREPEWAASCIRVNRARLDELNERIVEIADEAIGLQRPGRHVLEILDELEHDFREWRMKALNAEADIKKQRAAPTQIAGEVGAEANCTCNSCVVARAGVR